MLLKKLVFITRYNSNYFFMLSYSVITIISVYTFIYVYENCYNDVLKIL